MPLALLSPLVQPCPGQLSKCWCGDLAGGWGCCQGSARCCSLGLLMALVSPASASCSVVAPWDPSCLPPPAPAFSSACCCPGFRAGGAPQLVIQAPNLFVVAGGHALVAFYQTS